MKGVYTERIQLFSQITSNELNDTFIWFIHHIKFDIFPIPIKITIVFTQNING